MLVRKHVIYGGIFSVLLFLIFPNQIGIVGALLVFASSILIDTDHYLYSVFKDKSFNLKKSIKYFLNARDKRSKIPFEKRKNYYAAWCFIHGVESLIVLFVLGVFVSPYFNFILIGIGFHLTLDWIEQVQNGGRIDKISLIYDYFKFKKLKRL